MEKEQNEKEFQNAYTAWENNGKKEDSNWNKMWFCVLFAAKNIIKHRLSITKAHLSTEEIEGKALDATLLVMKDIKIKGRRPNKLSAYLSWPIMGVLYNSKDKAFDQCVSYEEWIEPIINDDNE